MLTEEQLPGKPYRFYIEFKQKTKQKNQIHLIKPIMSYYIFFPPYFKIKTIDNVKGERGAIICAGNVVELCSCQQAVKGKT